MAQVVFLRAVNVGGHKTFRPSLLVKQLKACDVVNVGAAGTFVIRNRISQANLKAELLRRLPFEPEIMICSDREMMDAVSRAPFDKQSSDPRIVRFVGVMSRRARSLPPLPLNLPAGEWLVKLIAVHDRFVFGMYRRQMGAIGQLGRVEKLLGVAITIRNWNTISAIVRALEGA